MPCLFDLHLKLFGYCQDITSFILLHFAFCGNRAYFSPLLLNTIGVAPFRLLCIDITLPWPPKQKWVHIHVYYMTIEFIFVLANGKGTLHLSFSSIVLVAVVIHLKVYDWDVFHWQTQTLHGLSSYNIFTATLSEIIPKILLLITYLVQNSW